MPSHYTPPMERRTAIVLLAVFGTGVFLAGLELMITAVALPSILASLVDANGSSAWIELRKASWIINGYLLVYILTMPMAGRLTDLWGAANRRKHWPARRSQQETRELHSESYVHSFGWALAKNDVHEEPVGRRVVSADSLHPRDAPAPIHTGEVDHQVDRKRDGLADAGMRKADTRR